LLIVFEKSEKKWNVEDKTSSYEVGIANKRIQMEKGGGQVD